MPEPTDVAAPAAPCASLDHTHNAGCVCLLAPPPARPLHRFTFDGATDAAAIIETECTHGCGTTWKQMLGGAE